MTQASQNLNCKNTSCNHRAQLKHAPSTPVPSRQTVKVLGCLENLPGSAAISAHTAWQAERLLTLQFSVLVCPNLPHTAVLSPISVNLGMPSLQFLSIYPKLPYWLMPAGLARISANTSSQPWQRPAIHRSVQVPDLRL